jgi:hypothetical protein
MVIIKPMIMNFQSTLKSESFGNKVSTLVFVQDSRRTRGRLV